VHKKALSEKENRMEGWKDVWAAHNTGLNFLHLKNDLVKKTDQRRRWTESQPADGKDQGSLGDPRTEMEIMSSAAEAETLSLKLRCDQALSDLGQQGQKG
jgi:hypothetical protein